MELASAFDTFITNISPTESMREDMIDAHTKLRHRLMQDEKLKPLLITTFLQGSYARHTNLRPKEDKRSDVDIVVVTNIDEEEYTPLRAQNLFVPFLNKYYEGKWKRQGRSLGIEMSKVDMDLVITSSPGHVDAKRIANVFGDSNSPDTDYRDRPLRIPNRDTKQWESTDPITQLLWTRQKNKKTSGDFTRVVRALKWWRLENGIKDACDSLKSYPLERVIAEYCPDQSNYFCDFLIQILANVPASKPILNDHSSAVSADVLTRVSDGDWDEFYRRCRNALELARRAKSSIDTEESHNLWRRLFGSKFPPATIQGRTAKSSFPTPSLPASPKGPERFA